MMACEAEFINPTFSMQSDGTPDRYVHETNIGILINNDNFGHRQTQPFAPSQTLHRTSHPMAEDQTRSALLRASQPPSQAFFSTLLTANHILHYHNVVDAYGHISVRNPQDPNTFFISKSLAPALVSSRDDLEEYRVSDASPVNENAPRGYAERFIHSEIYKKYKGVNSVVHAHSEVVLPFAMSSIPLRPV